MGMKLAPGTASLGLSGRNESLGEASEELDVDVIGQPSCIWCQPRYLAEFLDAVSADQIQLFINNPLEPMLARPVGDADYAYVVMPIRGE